MGGGEARSRRAVCDTVLGLCFDAKLERAGGRKGGLERFSLFWGGGGLDLDLDLVSVLDFPFLSFPFLSFFLF